VCDIVQLWEDELSPDKPSSPEDGCDHHIADNEAGGDDTVRDDGTEDPCSMSPESEAREADNHDADLRASVGDASQQIADKSESNKQEYLISFDDDDDAELGGPAPDGDAADCDAEKLEDNIPPDSPSQDVADMNADVSDDAVGMQESIAGEM